MYKIKEYNQKNEEFVKIKQLLLEMELRFEISEKENVELKEKLNQRVYEIQLLKNNLELTKNQLDKVTEKVNSLTIEDVEEETKQTCITVEKENQTEPGEVLIKDLIKRSSNLTDIGCQTLESETHCFKTDSKCLQTSFNEFLNDKISNKTDNETEVL